MSDFKQLPYLLDLWDDTSPSVHEGVLKGFASFGRHLYEWLPLLDPVIDMSLVKDVFRELRDELDDPKGVHAHLQLYQPGQLVEHRRHGYRGVIVDVDFFCMADERWYQNNTTQPPKLQPWYHVLVDKSDAVTYAAESSILADDDKVPVQHPYINHFFHFFKEGVYVRNDRPWPREEDVK